MAERYGHLVQDIAGSSFRSIFLALPNTITIVREIVVCNTDSEKRKFSLAIVKNGELLSRKHYLFYETEIGANETLTLSCTMCMDPGSEMMFGADEADVVTVSCFGVLAGSGLTDELTASEIFLQQWTNIKEDIEEIKDILTWKDESPS